MPRLKFDLKPVSYAHRSTPAGRAENDAWVKDVWAKYGRPGEPGPCDCGYYADDALVMCDAKDRVACKAGIEKRLEHHYREAHLKALRQKREFPGAPFYGKPGCNWCGQPIVHGRVAQRGWHDGRLDEPDCRYEFDLRTRRDMQQSFLVNRDGMGCRSCGKPCGHWHAVFTLRDEEDARSAWEKRGWLSRRFPEFPGWVTPILWSSHLEVDHILPLGAAWLAFPDADRRRWFFGPANLAGLCSECHREKTTDDVRFIRQLQAMDTASARNAVLDRMSELNLLKGQTK